MFFVIIKILYLYMYFNFAICNETIELIDLKKKPTKN